MGARGRDPLARLLLNKRYVSHDDKLHFTHLKDALGVCGGVLPLIPLATSCEVAGLNEVLQPQRTKGRELQSAPLRSGSAFEQVLPDEVGLLFRSARKSFVSDLSALP